MWISLRFRGSGFKLGPVISSKGVVSLNYSWKPRARRAERALGSLPSSRASKRWTQSFEEELGARGQQLYFEGLGGLGGDVEDAAGREVDAEVAGFDFELDFGAWDEGFGEGELEDAGGVGENFLAGGEEGDFGVGGQGGGGCVAGVEEAADEEGLGLGDGGEEDGEGEAAEHGLVAFFKTVGEGDGIGPGRNSELFVAGLRERDVKGVAWVGRDGEG